MRRAGAGQLQLGPKTTLPLWQPSVRVPQEPAVRQTCSLVPSHFLSCGHPLPFAHRRSIVQLLLHASFFIFYLLQGAYSHFRNASPSIARTTILHAAVMNAKLSSTVRFAQEAHAPAARPSLSVRCPSSPPEKAAITELAMTIAEEIASLSRSPQPIGIDVPLKHSGLDPKTLHKFHDWLKSAHDYDASFSRLLEDDTTAEVLAADILGEPFVFPQAAHGVHRAPFLAVVSANMQHPPARDAAVHCRRRPSKGRPPAVRALRPAHPFRSMSPTSPTSSPSRLPLSSRALRTSEWCRTTPGRARRQGKRLLTCAAM